MANNSLLALLQSRKIHVNNSNLVSPDLKEYKTLEKKFFISTPFPLKIDTIYLTENL